MRVEKSKNKLPIILVCGGSCSGKSSFAKLFKHALVLSMDHFYVGKDQMVADEKGNYDFDAPESVDIVGCAEAVKELAERKTVTIPVYDMKTSDRVGTQKVEVPPDTELIVVEGIFSFYSPLRETSELRIFLDTPMEVRVARRMLRDTEKGRSNIDTLTWSVVVEKNHAKYIEPMKEFASLVIPFNYNPVKIDDH